MFDTLENIEKPWRPCPSEEWCFVYSDRMSFSIVNEQLPYFFDQKHHAGFLASPLHVNLLCSWFIDYGTMDKQCDPPGVRDDCLPGCWVGAPNWCTGSEDKVWDCAWPSNLTKEMLENHLNRLGLVGRRNLGARYNELILSWDSFTKALPDSIEAFIFSEWDAEPLARQAHRRFLLDYPTASTPLLYMDIASKDEVFSRVV